MIHEEVRKKIVKAQKKGMRVAEICNAYEIGKSAVYGLLKLGSETGDIHPRTDRCGRKTILCESDLVAIDQLIQKQRDITLTNWAIAIKKTIHASERERPDVAAKREAWEKTQPDMDAGKLVFLEESGVNTNMARLYARAKGGKRARTVDALLAAIPLAFASVMPSDISGWFDHCGYSASFL